MDNCAGRLAQKDSHPDSLQHKMRLVYYVTTIQLTLAGTLRLMSVREVQPWPYRKIHFFPVKLACGRNWIPFNSRISRSSVNGPCRLRGRLAPKGAFSRNTTDGDFQPGLALRVAFG